MNERLSASDLRIAAGDDRVPVTISLPRHLFLFLSSKASEIDASFSGLLKVALSKYCEGIKSLDPRVVAKTLKKNRCFDKYLKEIWDKLKLDPDDLADDSIPSPVVNQSEDDGQSLVASKATGLEDVAAIKRQLAELQSKIDSLAKS